VRPLNPMGVKACESHVHTTGLASRSALFRIRKGERVHVETSHQGVDRRSARDDEAAAQHYVLIIVYSHTDGWYSLCHVINAMS
jgi:hypothetical protein